MFALPCNPTGFHDRQALSLPHAANGRFKAMISCDQVPGFGQKADVHLPPALSVDLVFDPFPKQC
jgi:hypothetical protein